MTKKGKKGGGGLMKTLGGFIASLAILGVVLASLSALGVYSLNDSLTVAKEKALKYAECIPRGDCGITTVIDDISGEGIDLDLGKLVTGGQNVDGATPKANDGIRGQIGYRGPESGEPYVTSSGIRLQSESTKELSKLTVVSDDSKDVGYSRKEWKHWSSVEGKSCWNTREEVLKRDAVPGSLKMVDNSKNAVKTADEACAIGIPKEKDGKTIIETNLAGKWIDPYSGDTIKDSSKVDIDHIIPLSKAARSGGQAWDEATKEKFANDLDNLLAVSAKENRAKSDKGPGEYMPSNKSYHCQYAKSYISVASKYKLTINKGDKEALDKALASCSL